MVVGGYAVALHGYPRYTKDIDFLDGENVIQLGYPPARIDLLTELIGIDFEHCFEKRMVMDINGLEVNFIDVDSLIETKILTDRPQDKIDAEQLKKGKN